jgi:hypothetical protein
MPIIRGMHHSRQGQSGFASRTPRRDLGSNFAAAAADAVSIVMAFCSHYSQSMERALYPDCKIGS